MPVVAVYVNLHPDHFFGYQPGHPLQKVFGYEIPTTSDAYTLADEAFAAFNAPLELLNPTYRAIAKAYRAAGNRSLSVGDVLRIGDTWLACAPTGWVELDQAPVEATDE